MILIIWYIDTVTSFRLSKRDNKKGTTARSCNDPKWKMWGWRYGGIFLQAFSEEGTCRQCARDHGSGKDGPIVGRISQFRNHRPEPVTNRSYRPSPGSFRQQREDEHGRVYGTENQSSTCQVTPFPPSAALSPSSLRFSFGLASPRQEHPIVAPNLLLQIYRPTALKRHPLVTYTRVQSINGINYVPPMGLASFRHTEMKHVQRDVRMKINVHSRLAIKCIKLNTSLILKRCEIWNIDWK